MRNIATIYGPAATGALYTLSTTPFLLNDEEDALVAIAEAIVDNEGGFIADTSPCAGAALRLYKKGLVDGSPAYEGVYYTLTEEVTLTRW